jgi:glycosyltransferase involved in cell wall biosynthesis
MKPKALLFANTDRYLYHFRLSLLHALADSGWEVVLVSPPGDYGDRLRQLGFRLETLEFSTGSMNPVREAAVLASLVRLYRRERPALAHHFTTKCVIYGSLAARLLPDVAVVNAVVGMGYLFSGADRRSRVLRHPIKLAYRTALSLRKSRLILQNEGDREAFIGGRLVPAELTRVIRGSGVDCDLFRPEPEARRSTDASVRVLLATRLLRDKGVYEYAEAAAALRERYPRAEFILAGYLYPDNPSSLRSEELQTLVDSGGLRYLGYVEDIPDLLRSVDIVVLPTAYLEGTPRILVEAAATERPIVATDIPACRGLVRDGITGFLVPTRDVAALTEALGKLIADGDLRRRMGRVRRVS